MCINFLSDKLDFKKNPQTYKNNDYTDANRLIWVRSRLRTHAHRTLAKWTARHPHTDEDCNDESDWLNWFTAQCSICASLALLPRHAAAAGEPHCLSQLPLLLVCRPPDDREAHWLSSTPWQLCTLRSPDRRNRLVHPGPLCPVLCELSSSESKCNRLSDSAHRSP